MTTVTIVTGDPQSGKRLIGQALAEFISRQGKITVVAVQETPMPHEPVPIDDLILISSNNSIESWMEPWLNRYGHPMFSINSLRFPEGRKQQS